MNNIFYGILSVGFDIDQTMYAKNSEIDLIIQDEIARKILEIKPSFNNLESAKEFSERRYSELGSRTSVLEEVGYKNAQEILYGCISSDKTINPLQKDERLQEMISRLGHKYDLFLITNNSEDIATKKLDRLGVDKSLFNLKFYGDTLPGIKKSDGSLFKYFLSRSKHSPENHIYVGDSLNADIIPSKKLGFKTICVGNHFLEANYSVKEIYDIENLLL